MNVPPSRHAKLYVVSESADLFKASAAFLEKLASVSEVIAVDEYKDADSVAIITDSANLYIPLADMVDFEKELERLEKELAKAEKEISVFERKLSNADFVARAPEAVVAGERAKLEKYKAQREGVLAEIEKIRARLK